MTADRVRRAAEHEAAHAVVAEHYGVTVESIAVDSTGNGCTRYGAEMTTAIAPIAAVAGDLWQREFSECPYVDLSCSDLAKVVRLVGTAKVWQVERAARAVLTARRRRVLDLAERVRVERHLVGARSR